MIAAYIFDFIASGFVGYHVMPWFEKRYGWPFAVAALLVWALIGTTIFTLGT